MVEAQLFGAFRKCQQNLIDRSAKPKGATKMKKVILAIILVFVGTAGWRIGNNLSSDAISMAVGIFFGVLAGIPTALLLLASERYKTDRIARNRERTPQPSSYQRPDHVPANQPPVIILNGNGNGTPQGQSVLQSSYLPENNYDQTNGGFAMSMSDRQMADQAMAAPSERPARRFKVVGEQEEWLD